MRYFFEIASLGIEIKSEKELAFQPCMLPFKKEHISKVDLSYRIEKATTILMAKVNNAIERDGFRIFEENGKWARAYLVNWYGEDSYIISLPEKEEGNYILYIPETSVENKMLFSDLNIGDYLALEESLLKHNAIILHSSFVSWKRQGILFTAPSGTGKSTQADLWKKYKDAEIVNGDRTIIRKMQREYRGFGSPFAGTSGIFKDESVPIRAIVCLSQSKENRLLRISGKEAFLPIYRETLANTWNTEYMRQMMDLIIDISTSIPVYHLACLPNRDAVELVCNKILT